MNSFELDLFNALVDTLNDAGLFEPKFG